MSITESKITAVVLVTTLLAVGCTREASNPATEQTEASGTPTEQSKVTGTASACNVVSAPMTAVRSLANEPQIVIPQPAGWERDPENESEERRFAMANGSLKAGRIASATVALRTLQGHRDPATELESVRVRTEKDPGNTHVTATDTEVCGFPGQTVHFTRTSDGLPSADETLLVVVVPAADETHQVAVTTRTTHGDDPEYQRAIGTILSGVQVLTPATA
ncbi:LpqN/LpqT family lipoprotein [Mycolicibacterium flavescens]|uniref:LpqN/LpqT family lipoprotein n=1 Tax=Mycolicibacterium flavescens TaxID=1776 RepID=UPI001041D81C|nr:LpqN/LpqT family lipoprotein [Mycolicibacterium flavescens]MCV7282231.1 LpqN/LpqT family lipoprotein [Mycolicibacterium flavescens]